MEQLQAQAKAPGGSGRGETLVVETLYGEKRLPPADGVGRAVPQLQNQKRWPAMTSFWERTAQTAGTAGWRACAVWRR